VKLGRKDQKTVQGSRLRLNGAKKIATDVPISASC
jgi:hypothetical protein